jgi:C4-dicarboxylate transporter, DctM subunit
VDPDLIAIGGFAVLFGLIALRVPIGIAMGIVGVGGFAMIVGIEPSLHQLSLVTLRAGTTHSFGLIPMFILMGAFATASGMSAELFRAANAWMGHRRGGLAMATVAACGGFAAISGSSVATAATMTRVALPEMRAAGYSPAMAAGAISAGGTIGILIPPSVVFAVYGIITDQDIARLFIAGLLPGILSVLLYLATIRIIGWISPESVPVGLRTSWPERWRSVRGVWPMALLFLFIIGGIYGGLFTPTEAAGAGAAGAFLIGVARGKLTWRAIVESLVESIRTSAGIFLVLFGALLFGYFLAVTQTPQQVTAWLVDLGLGPYQTLLLILLVYLVLGCALDPLAMIVLTIPVVFPVITAFGLDPIWFGVVMVITVEMALITPPIGLNVYVINSVQRDIDLVTIFRGVLPFVVTDVVRLSLVIAFPTLALFLPGRM